MNENLNPELIVNFDSSSDSENEADFSGFDITDVRSTLDEADRVALFTSTPRQKKHEHARYRNFDGELVSLATADKVDCTKTLTKDSEIDLDLSGELVDSIFYSSSNRKKPKTEDSVSSGDSEIEGETFLDSHEWDSSSENSDDQQPEQPEVNNATPQAKKRGKVDI